MFVVDDSTELKIKRPEDEHNIDLMRIMHSPKSDKVEAFSISTFPNSPNGENQNEEIPKILKEDNLTVHNNDHFDIRSQNGPLSPSILDGKVFQLPKNEGLEIQKIDLDDGVEVEELKDDDLSPRNTPKKLEKISEDKKNLERKEKNFKTKIEALENEKEDKQKQKEKKRSKEEKKIKEETEIQEEKQTEEIPEEEEGEDKKKQKKNEKEQPKQKKGNEDIFEKVQRIIKVDMNTPFLSEFDNDYIKKNIRSICMLPYLKFKKPSKEEPLVRCYVVRQKGSILTFPKFTMFAEQNITDPNDPNQSKKKDDIFMMSAKRKGNNKTSNYHISTDKNNIQKGNKETYLGKVRGTNLLGTKYAVFDEGQDRKSRSEMGAILYETGLLSSSAKRGPRKMTVLVPKIENGKYKVIKEGENELVENYETKSDWSDMHVLKSRGPQWNPDLKAYVLNFNGRVAKPSVKNFQLIDPNNSDTLILQFGRLADDIFNLDFRYPLSPFLAFSIILTSFDWKIGVE